MRDLTHEPVAIVGMACLFPGAPDLATYWRNIVGGVDSTGEPPPEWHAERYLDAGSSENDRVYVTRGGWLGELATFDPLEFGVMPTSVDGGEPDQFLALAVARAAMRDATGTQGPADPARTGVIVGHGTYVNRGFGNVLQHGMVIDQTLRLLRRLQPERTDEALEQLKVQLKSELPPFNAEMAPGLVPNVLTGRIANRLDLMGPNYTVDAACASSLVAVDQAMRELREGRCDLMLAGGVHTSTTPPIMQIFCQLGALSRQAVLRPFDERADGTLLGEGAGFIALKRLADAVADDDRVYAVLRSVGIASDGRASGLLAPRVDGEVLAIRRAYEEAAVDPATVSMVEAHGTGTAAGDEAELAALTAVFGSAGPAGPSVALGSVKSMIGHLLPAAGMAGIIKAALALHHGVLPPSLHCEEPRAALRSPETRFYTSSRPRPWVHGGPEPRRAAVDAFGFGGIDAHALLEEAPRPAPTLSGLPEWPVEVVALGALDRAGLLEECRRLLSEADGSPLVDVARRSWEHLAVGTPHRMAVVAGSADELEARVRRAAEVLAGAGDARLWDPTGTFMTSNPLWSPGAVAFLFPGEGSPYPGMLAEAAMAFPVVRRWFDVMEQAFVGHERGFGPARAVFPPPGVPPTDDLLHRTDVGPESLFAASQGLLALLGELRIEPDAVVGHSSGEWSALVAAGCLPVDDLPRLVSGVVELNRLFTELDDRGALPGATLLTVGGVPGDVVQAVARSCGDTVSVAAFNCPHQAVLCGPEKAIAEAARALGERGAVCEQLPFGRAYHTPLFAEFSRAVRAHLDRLDLQPPRRRLLSCVTAADFPQDTTEVRHLAAAQWSMPVRFSETVETLHSDGARIFVEVGPSASLTSFVRDTLRGRPHLAVASDQRELGIRALPLLVGQLHAHGVPLDPAVLFGGRETPVSPAGPRLATSMPDLDLDGSDVLATGPTALPTSSLPLTRVPSPGASSAPMSSSNGRREQVLHGHLALMEQFLDVQSSVLGMLRGAGTTTETPPARQEEPTPTPPSSTHTDPAAEGSSVPGPDVDTKALTLTLRQVLAERTGYPEQLLADDLDLEAELGIDSIKRVETLAAVQRVHGTVPGGLGSRVRGLRTIRAMAEAMAGAAASGDGAAITGPDDHRTARLPFVDEVLEQDRAGRARVRCVWDAARDPALLDHTFEHGPVSALDESARGLPVVPLTMSLELAAEAALVAAESGVVISIEDVEALRWTDLETGPRAVLAVVEPAQDGRYAVVLQHEADGSELLRAWVRVGSARPDPPASGVLDLPAPIDISGDHSDDEEGGSQVELYGPDGLFHGPAFHVVESLGPTDTSTATAALVSTGQSALLGRRDGDATVLDAALLDGPGQVLAHWLAARTSTRRDVFPVRLAAMELYAEPAPDPAHYGCGLTDIRLDDDTLTCDAEVTDASGRTVARLRGWHDVRLDCPSEVRRVLADPVGARVGEAWRSPGPPDGWLVPVVGRRVLLPSALGEHGAVWLRVLAHAVLHRDELPTWHSLSRSPARRLEWLAGRLAAKEAVRDVLSENGERLALGDIAFTVGERGRPIVAAAAGFDRALHVSITHSDGEAVALASTVPVGVDLQQVGSVPAGIEDLAFDCEERRLLDGLDDLARARVAARLWAAKEAVAKTTGAGLPLRPAELATRLAPDAIEAIDLDGVGSVALRVQSDGSALEAWTDIIGPVAYAACQGTGGDRP